ncbi:MAG: glycosyltransferase family 2 protein [Fibrobacterota bacterium]
MILESPQVTVVVVNWNGQDILGACLNSLMKLEFPHVEIIVVDNASTDESVKIAGEYAGSIRLIAQTNNDGYAKACNAGIREAKGRYIVTLNNDMVVEPSWLNEAIPFLESHPDVGIISCRQMNFHIKNKVDSLFHIITRSLIFCEYGNQSHFHNIPISYVISANGGSAIIRATLIEQLGGFDESFIAYHEECDLFFRAFQLGWKCVFIPSAIVYHRRGFSFEKPNTNRFFFFERNRYRFIMKNYPLTYVIKSLPVLILKEASIMLNTLRKPLLWCAYFRARASFIGYFLSLRWKHSSKPFTNQLTCFSKLRRHGFIPLS